MIWVAGEALIDLVPTGNSREAIVGGGAANTAKALARLGLPISFIGGISSDQYGELIRAELDEVDLSLILNSSAPTATALVSLDQSGSATYEFNLEGTATFDFRSEWLPKGEPEVLHVGTLATLVQPGADALFDWAASIKAPIIYDPNVRPSVLSDKSSYREIVEKWASISTVIKLSDEDLDWLGIKEAEDFFDCGVELVVLTRGSEGITGFTRKGALSVPAVKVEVVDTVGAGDTVGAVLAESLSKYGLIELIDEQLFGTLSRAARAAAITCSRRGANPPTASELN